MPAAMSEDKSGGRAALVAAIAVAAATLLVRFPPMTDLPLHAATVGLLRHFSDPAFVPPGLYKWNFGHSNQLFHLLAWALSYPFGVDGACKLVVAASQVGIVLGGRRLARHVGASSWCALFFVPIAIGWTFRFGLVANLLGVGLLFAALPDLDDASAGPRVPEGRSLGRSCLWMAVLYAAHFSVVVIAALIVGLFALLRARRDGPRALLLRLLPCLFAAALVGAQQVAQRLTIATQGMESGGVVWRSPLQNALELPYTLTGLPDVAVSCALALLTLLGIFSFAASGVHANRFLLVAAFLLGASLITPFGIARGTLFSQRFFAPGLGLLVVGLAARTTPSPVTRLQRLLASAVPLAFVAFLVPELVDADQQNRALDQLLVRMQPGSAVVAIEAESGQGGPLVRPRQHGGARGRLARRADQHVLQRVGHQPGPPAAGARVARERSAPRQQHRRLRAWARLRALSLCAGAHAQRGDPRRRPGGDGSGGADARAGGRVAALRDHRRGRSVDRAGAASAGRRSRDVPRPVHPCARPSGPRANGR